MARDAVRTPSATQQVLPFLEPAPLVKPLSLTPASVQRLWFCIWLPGLPLEACRSSDEAVAIVAEQHGIHRVLLADPQAEAAGVMAGQSANAALALLPTLQLVERSPLREQQALEALATWLERFSSSVCIADRDVLLLEIAGSLRLFGGLRELREKVSKGLRQHGFAASLAIAPTPLGATWLARAGRRVCIRDEQNLTVCLLKRHGGDQGWRLSAFATRRVRQAFRCGAYVGTGSCTRAVTGSTQFLACT